MVTRNQNACTDSGSLMESVDLRVKFNRRK